MNEKGKEFIFYNKPYMPSAGLHGPLHMVCALSLVPAPTLALDLHAHTQLYCLLLLGQRGVNNFFFSSFNQVSCLQVFKHTLLYDFCNLIDISLLHDDS